MPLANLIRTVLRIGPLDSISLGVRKIAKRSRYAWMIQSARNSCVEAKWKAIVPISSAKWPDIDRERIISQANAMLRDENTFFSFPYHMRSVERVWEFDPLEKKYWPRRHYTEQHLHAADTPRDVKIVWEINRFKDLPVLGQAYALTGDDNYAEEAIRRMVSWIDGNPFASTVNWASALEISIRLISWTTTIALLRGNIEPKIAQSIHEQARYLAADLSTDKVVPSNHLIGEAAGLFLVSSLWKFPQSTHYATQAKHILRKEIIRQTFQDGVTREASSWYHQFVTDFCDLADRVGALTGNAFDETFRNRLAAMKAFLEAMTVNDSVIRFGDVDDGWALLLSGFMEKWKNELFGAAPTIAANSPIHYYKYSRLIAAHLENSFLFLRAGTFGMGGAGSSSHAHDDFLSPVIYLEGEAVLADPGTYVYNGNPKDRNRFRVADAHNGIILGTGTEAEPKLNFGWNRTRVDAEILEVSFTDREAIVISRYGEWPQHRRILKVNQDVTLIVDHFDQSLTKKCTWHLHLDPQWNLREQQFGYYLFQGQTEKLLSIKLRGNFDTVKLLPYDFSPSYGVLVSATMLEFSASIPSGVYAILLAIDTAL